MRFSKVLKYNYMKREKIIPYKKRLFTSRWRFNPFLKQNGNYVTVVSLSGFLKRDDITIIENIIDRDLLIGINRFIVNFSNVNHIHYKDVNLLVNIKKKLDKYYGEIKFVVKKPYIVNILVVGGWPSIYNFYPSEKSAINTFRKEHFLTWRENAHNPYSGSIEGNY